MPILTSKLQLLKKIVKIAIPTLFSKTYLFILNFIFQFYLRNFSSLAHVSICERIRTIIINSMPTPLLHGSEIVEKHTGTVISAGNA